MRRSCIGAWAANMCRDALTRLRCLSANRTSGNFAALLAVLFFPLLLVANPQTNSRSTIRSDSNEQRAARAFERERANPLELRDFLSPYA